MLRLAADENFNGHIVRGLFRRLPDLDLVRVQDTPLAAAPDEEMLEWAAGEGRVVLTHDLSTLRAAAEERVRSGLPMPGVIAIRSTAPIGKAIEEIILILETARPEEIDRSVVFVSLQ